VEEFEVSYRIRATVAVPDRGPPTGVPPSPTATRATRLAGTRYERTEWEEEQKC
jgi:hypothetical protein